MRAEMGLLSSVARSRASGDERGCAVVVARARLLACGHATCAAAAAADDDDDDDARGDRRSDVSRAFLGALGAVAGSPSIERASSSIAFGADTRCALTGEVAVDPAAAAAAGSDGVLTHMRCSLRAAAAARRAGKSMVSTSTWSVPDGVHRNETRCARSRCAAALSWASSWATSLSNGTESSWCLRRS